MNRVLPERPVRPSLRCPSKFLALLVGLGLVGDHGEPSRKSGGTARGAGPAPELALSALSTLPVSPGYHLPQIELELDIDGEGFGNGHGEDPLWFRAEVGGPAELAGTWHMLLGTVRLSASESEIEDPEMDFMLHNDSTPWSTYLGFDPGTPFDDVAIPPGVAASLLVDMLYPVSVIGGVATPVVQKTSVPMLRGSGGACKQVFAAQRWYWSSGFADLLDSASWDSDPTILSVHTVTMKYAWLRVLMDDSSRFASATEFFDSDWWKEMSRLGFVTTMQCIGAQGGLIDPALYATVEPPPAFEELTGTLAGWDDEPDPAARSVNLALSEQRTFSIAGTRSEDPDRPSLIPGGNYSVPPLPDRQVQGNEQLTFEASLLYRSGTTARLRNNRTGLVHEMPVSVTPSIRFACDQPPGFLVNDRVVLLSLIVPHLDAPPGPSTGSSSTFHFPGNERPKWVKVL